MTITLTSTVTEHTFNKVVRTVTEETVPHHVMVERLHEQIVEAGPHHFNMSTWFHSRDGGINDLNFVLPEYERTVNIRHCGTTGCLAGHAAIFARDNGITDLITQVENEWGRDGRPVVDQTRILQLLGMPWGVFSSAHHNWHPVAQAAYIHDLQSAVTGVSWLADDDDDDDMPPMTPVKWSDISLDNVETDRIVDDGDIVDAYPWVQEAKHHAEWVAVCTYLRYVALMSASVYENGDTAEDQGYSSRDLAYITGSPAFKDPQSDTDQGDVFSNSLAGY
jgi:hypothetical protein